MLLHWQLYNFLNTYTNNYPYNISHFITNHSLNILSAPHPSSLFKTELHKGSNRKPTRSWRSERLRLPSVTLNAEVKGWHLDQVSVRGGKSTTQQRKPYFIKLENKNIILGTKIKKKRNGWKRGKCKWSQGRDMTGGLWYLCLRNEKAHTVPSHLNQKPIQSDLQRSTQDSFLHPVVGFTFSPGQSRRRVSAGENLDFPTIGLFHKAAVPAPGEVPS